MKKEEIQVFGISIVALFYFRSAISGWSCILRHCEIISEIFYTYFGAYILVETYLQYSYILV